MFRKLIFTHISVFFQLDVIQVQVTGEKIRVGLFLGRCQIQTSDTLLKCIQFLFQLRERLKFKIHEKVMENTRRIRVDQIQFDQGLLTRVQIAWL